MKQETKPVKCKECIKCKHFFECEGKPNADLNCIRYEPRGDDRGRTIHSGV